MATHEEPTLDTALKNTFDDLTKDDLESFKYYLTCRSLLNEFKMIPKSLLETANSTQTLKAMKNTYGNNTITVIKRILEEMQKNNLLEELSKFSFDPEAILSACQTKIKSKLSTKFKFLTEGITKKDKKTSFHERYTEVYVTVEDTEQVTEEHEISYIERSSRNPAVERTIQCQDIFRGYTKSSEPIREEMTDEEEPIRTMLTKGVAGVGKTVVTQKFILDWAEGRANQDIQLLFPFTFGELNVLRDTQLSLVELLEHFFSEAAGLWSFEGLQVVFIFDGLDECRLPLDFNRTRLLTETTEPVSVDVLLVNLIRGTLLPSARLWIITRPAAANQIPDECVSMVTVVRGFTDPLKEQYFRKRFRDQQQATAIISHIRTSRSLHSMCYIPVFCRIVSTVIENILKKKLQDLPKTMTILYIHFLVIQLKQKNIKYSKKLKAESAWSPENKKMVESLAKLAFEQLQRGNLIFCESDLSKCCLDPAEASVYSGLFTQVFREEPGLYVDTFYCFIQKSVQEFLAALHVHLTFFSTGVNLLLPQQTSESLIATVTKTSKQSIKTSRFKLFTCFTTSKTRSSKQRTQQTSESPDPEAAFYRSAVDQDLQSPNGHLNLFQRFLLGMSLSTNQSLLQDLLTRTRSSSTTNQETVEYIKKKLDEDLSVERRLNLFHCLNELNDRSLVEKIQENTREGGLSKNITRAQWENVVFILLSSDSDLEEFDLKKYRPSQEALLNLLPVVKVSTKAILSSCNLSQSCCGPLSSVLSSSSLTHLDLSHNPLQDSGVKLLCSGLKSAPCRLENLGLSCCDLSQNSCGPLSSVLSFSSLTHLDLSHNDLQDSGVELLCSGLKSAPCRLETLRLSGCLISEKGVASLASALSSAPSHLRELDLSYNHPGPSAKRLTALQDDPNCPLHSFRLDSAGERWMAPGLRKYSCELSLDPNTAHTKLLLSEDKQTVNRVEEEQQYPDHEDRFSNWGQVLSSTGLTGRCYWELDWSGEGVVIAVSYRGIRRKGMTGVCIFGGNDQSWSLCFYGEEISVEHNKRSTKIYPSSGRVGVHSGRVGVFLDSEAGSLSFYEVLSDGKLAHLYTFSSTFTEPLFLGIGLQLGSSVSVVDVSGERPLVDRP